MDLDGELLHFFKLSQEKILKIMNKKWTLIVEADPDETVLALKNRITSEKKRTQKVLETFSSTLKVIAEQEPWGAHRMTRALCRCLGTLIAVFRG